MAKGFGPKKSEQLGYVLALSPSLNVYAASFSLDEEFSFDYDNKEDFIGITNMIDGAQIWKTKKQARQAIPLYAEFLLEQMEENPEVRVHLKCLKRSSGGELTEEFVESLAIVAVGENIEVVTLGRQ